VRPRTREERSDKRGSTVVGACINILAAAVEDAVAAIVWRLQIPTGEAAIPIEGGDVAAIHRGPHLVTVGAFAGRLQHRRAALQALPGPRERGEPRGTGDGAASLWLEGIVMVGQGDRIEADGAQPPVRLREPKKERIGAGVLGHQGHHLVRQAIKETVAMRRAWRWIGSP
jgi:hypothetical protein